VKAVINNRIFIEGDSNFLQKLREQLTYRIATYGDGPPMIVQNFAMFRSNIISIPVGRTDLIPAGYEIVDKRCFAPIVFPPFRGKLRDSQQAIYDEVDDNCLINAKVGWGKTFMALALAAKLGQKTLIVVHTLPLMHQWAKEVEKVFGFKPGLMGGGHDNSSTPIVIGNVGTLERRTQQIAKLFGTLIMDEVHHAPSRTFAKVVNSSHARYKIGLSGTLERKDGLHVTLRDFFGYKVYRPEKENTVDPIVHAHRTGIWMPFGDIWAHRVNELHNDPAFQAWTVSNTLKYIGLGHKVLVVADRVDFLKFIHEQVGGSITIGETEDRESQLQRIYDGTSNSMCGTISIWKEGISCNPLSCLLPASPINNEPMLEQLCGRVQRLHEGKLPPIVVDPILQGPTGQKQFTNRAGFYVKQGWHVEYL
jgi:superfamily II DNA or RNA helicase